MILGLLVALAPPTAERADAADLRNFQAGNIISNEVFFDSSAMTLREVENFVIARRGTCAVGYTCLPWYRESTPDRASDTYCNGYPGRPNESGAAIIWKVAQSCGINPQVLLVTLQKEQSLVTSPSPSSSAYRVAMGQGCPDTAACDTRYYGFFNQVYGAARQFKIYTENRYFTYYAPGRTWNLRYHPTSTCGSSPVFIANQATANLYYYTPYQPNAAALRAGYGTGDDCSAYGNRNFYNYFVDWFGDTQRSATRLFRVDGSEAVYLLSDGVKHQIKTYDDLAAFQSRLGDVRQMPASYGALFPTGKQISRYVHDPRSGTLLLIERDGTRHRFTSEAQIRTFGFQFDSYVDLPAAVLDQFTLGPEVNAFVRIGNGAEVFRLDGTTLRYVPSMEIWRAVSTGAPYAASVTVDVGSRWSRGVTLLPPGAMVRAADAPEVYMVGDGSDLLHVRDLRIAADWGVSQVFVVPAGMVDNWKKSAGYLAPVMACGTSVFVASDGGAVSVTGISTPLAPTSVASSICPALRVEATSVSTPVFVSSREDGRAFELRNGKLDYVPTYAELLSRNGTRPLRVLSWSTASAAAKGYLAPVLKDRQLVQFTDSHDVYVVESGVLRYVPTYGQLLQLSNGAPSIATLDSFNRLSLSFGAPLLFQGQIVRFADSNAAYLVDRGELRYVPTYPQLTEIAGGRPSIATLDNAHRNALKLGAAILNDGQLVQFVGAGEVFLVDAGALRHVSTWERLMTITGGQTPAVIDLPIAQRESYTYGADY